MPKKISMSTKPKRDAQMITPDDWVKGEINGSQNLVVEEKTKEQTARFTIDIPVSLHARIKSQCALKRVKMREEVLAILEEHFPTN